MTLNWPSRHLPPNRPQKILTLRTIQVCVIAENKAYATQPLCFTVFGHVDLYNLSVFVSEGEVMEKSVHPTAIMLTSTVNLLKTLSLSSGIHAEVMQADAISTLCGLLRILVESGANDKTGNGPEFL